MAEIEQGISVEELDSLMADVGDDFEVQTQDSADESLLTTVANYAGQVGGGVTDVFAATGPAASMGLVQPRGSDDTLGKKVLRGGGQALGIAALGVYAGGRWAAATLGEVAGTLVARGGSRTAVTAMAQAPEGSIAAKTVQQYTSSFGQAPLLATSSEFAAGGGSWAAMGWAAEEYPNSPVGQAFAGLAGGIGGGASPYAATLTPVSLVARTMIKSANQISGRVSGKVSPVANVGKRTEKAVKKSVTARVGTRGKEITEAAAEGEADLSPSMQGKLTLAERAGDKDLLSLEADIAKYSPELAAERQVRYQALDDSIRADLDDMTAAENVTVNDVRDYLDGLMATRIQMATQRTQEKVSGLTPRAQKIDSERLAGVELGKAESAGRAQERELWDAVPDVEVVGEPVKTQMALHEILSNLSINKVKNPDDLIPVKIRNMIGKLTPDGDFTPGQLDRVTTFDEFKELRSYIGTVIAKERAKPKPNRERIAYLGAIDRALLDDLDTMAPAGGEAYDIARAFSRDFHSRFSQGEVGKILGYDVKGERGVADDFILEGIEGTGVAARRRSEALLRAVERTGDIPAMKGHIEDYLKNEFRRYAGNMYTFDPKKAEVWIHERQDVLANFPELQKDLQRAAKAGLELKDAQDFLNPDVSAAAIFMGAPPGEEINAIFKSQDPTKAMQALVMALKQDPTGQAIKGGRKVYIDAILDRAAAEAKDEGGHFISGNKLEDVINSPAVQRTMKIILDPTQRKRLMQAVTETRKLEKARKAPMTGRLVAQDPTGMILDGVSRVGFAQFGRWIAGKTGGGTVQTPGIAVQYGLKLRDAGLNPARAILKDAITSTDDTLMKAILLDERLAGSAQKKEAYNRILGWYLTYVDQLGLNQETQEERIKSMNEMERMRYESRLEQGF